MGIFDKLFGKKKSRKSQRKTPDKKLSHKVPKGILRRGKIDPYAALTAAKMYFKTVTGKDLGVVTEVLLVKLLADCNKLNFDPNGHFSESYAFDLFMVIGKWTLGEDFRGRMLINSEKERQKYLNPKNYHYILLKGAGIEPVDVVSLFKSKKFASITKAFNSSKKLILCDVTIYEHLLDRWLESSSLADGMKTPALQTINQEELLIQILAKKHKEAKL